MNTDPEKFEIDLDGIPVKVIQSPTDKNIYRLNSPRGSYLIARDFYGVWVELNCRPGSSYISLSQAGYLIEEHHSSIHSV